MHELVRLGANESAFGPSPRAIAAMGAQLGRLAWYGDPDSLDLRDALATKHGCDPAHICVGAGIDDLMGLAVRAFVAPGTIAVTSRGTYPTFDYHVAGFGGRIERVDYLEDGRPDLDGLAERARAASAAIVYLANPDNPSGTFADRSAVARFAAVLPQQTALLLDEAYADFVDAGALPGLDFGGGILRMRTFSKAFGMAGARVGYVLADEETIATFQKIRLHYGVNRNAQIGALASLQDAEFCAWVVAETARGREEYYRLAADHSLNVIRSDTNFVCIDVGNAKRATAIVAELLEHTVWIRKPAASPLDRCIRVTVGTAPMRAAFAAAFESALAAIPA